MIPPRSRNLVLALLSSSIAINLIDRQTLSVVAPVMRGELHLSNTQYAYIVTAFQIGMFLGQVPAERPSPARPKRTGFRAGSRMVYSATGILQCFCRNATFRAVESNIWPGS